MPERRLLVLFLCSVLAFGALATAADLLVCRNRFKDCEKESAALTAALGMAASYASGILTKSPE